MSSQDTKQPHAHVPRRTPLTEMIAELWKGAKGNSPLAKILREEKGSPDKTIDTAIEDSGLSHNVGELTSG